MQFRPFEEYYLRADYIYKSIQIILRVVIIQ